MFDQFGNKLEKGDMIAVAFTPGLQNGVLLDYKDGRVVLGITIFLGDSQFLAGVVKVHKPDLPKA